MTRRRWIADEFSRDRAALTGAHAAHLARVLRARVGQEFEIACGDSVRLATVLSINEDRVEFALGQELSASMVAHIMLLLAVFKFDHMEWAIEKCTELNVTAIVPVITSRTEKHLGAAAPKRVERWRRIAREASEQARRTAPPEITDPVKLADALKRFGNCATAAANGGISGPPGPSLRIVLNENERDAMLADMLRSHDAVQSLALAIGPEGGWTAEELETFAEAGWISASVGGTILRAETAAVAALAIARATV